MDQQVAPSPFFHPKFPFPFLFAIFPSPPSARRWASPYGPCATSHFRHLQQKIRQAHLLVNIVYICQYIYIYVIIMSVQVCSSLFPINLLIVNVKCQPTFPWVPQNSHQHISVLMSHQMSVVLSVQLSVNISNTYIRLWDESKQTG